MTWRIGIEKAQCEEEAMRETETFRFLISGWLVLSAVMASPMAACAADYPSRPLRLVVPFPPGGAADILAREISPKLSAALRQQIIVDNRPGANGVVGFEDRKSTRLNSSHGYISYAVFCLKKKKNKK